MVSQERIINSEQFLFQDGFFNRKCKMKLQKKSRKLRFDNEKGWKVKKEECKIFI